MVQITEEKIIAYALKNALEHSGTAVQGAVLAGLFAEGLEKSEIKEYLPKIQDAIKKVNTYTSEQQKNEFEKLESLLSHREIREGLPELENAVQGKVIMRMAPYPSGPLHIGNARTLILNDEYVKKYGGRLYLVMDDTIGSAEKPIEPVAYKLIEEGIKWLEVNYSEIIYKSDRTEKYYEYAKELIKKGYIYICDCNSESWKKIKDEKKECPCRNLSSEEQLIRWKRMFVAEEGSLCARLKTSMSDPDPAFRDRVMFKISKRTHPRTKNKYSVYPSMEFSWAIDDHVLGVTHILRGIDHQMSTRIQDFIRGIFNWKNPISIYNGFFAVEGIKISKSKGSKEVKSGAYTGWNDPRTWSLQSLKDRGIKPEAIRNFIKNLGINKTNIKVPVEVLYSENKKLIEESPRYFFIENPKKIIIKGCPIIDAKLPLHPNKSKGFREYKTNGEFLIPSSEFEKIKEGNFRLMHLLNFTAHEIKNFAPVEYSFLSVEPNSKLKTSFVNWIVANEKNVPAKIRLLDGSLIEGLCENEISKVREGEIVQFERIGFVRLHKKSKEELEFWFTHK